MKPEVPRHEVADVAEELPPRHVVRGDGPVGPSLRIPPAWKRIPGLESPTAEIDDQRIYRRPLSELTAEVMLQLL